MVAQSNQNFICSSSSTTSTMTRITNFGRKRTFVEAGFSNTPKDEVGAESPKSKKQKSEAGVVEESEEKPKKSNTKAHKKLLKLKAKKAAAKGKGKPQSQTKDSGISPPLSPPVDRKPPSNKTPAQSPKAWRASLPLSEQRRQKRIAERTAETICFKCREKGHAAKDCPTSSTNLDSSSEKPSGKIGICYRCGSNKHTLSRCPKPTPADPANALPFASCFVCSAQGHLAGSCPQNKERGVYPNGGCCKICGDVGHLARECGVRSKGA